MVVAVGKLCHKLVCLTISVFLNNNIVSSSFKFEAINDIQNSIFLILFKNLLLNCSCCMSPRLSLYVKSWTPVLQSMTLFEDRIFRVSPTPVTGILAKGEIWRHTRIWREIPCEHGGGQR